MEHDPEYVFSSIEEILLFVEWVKKNFESPDDYSIWFENSLDKVVSPDVFCTRTVRSSEFLFSCNRCKAKFSTKAGLEVHTSVLHKDLQKATTEAEFWDIIKTAYEEEDEDQQGFDPDELSDTD